MLSPVTGLVNQKFQKFSSSLLQKTVWRWSYFSILYSQETCHFLSPITTAVSFVTQRLPPSVFIVPCCCFRSSRWARFVSQFFFLSSSAYRSPQMKNPPITLLGQNACFCRKTDDLPRAVMGEFVSKGNFYRQVWNHILISLMDSQHGDASGCMVGRKWCAAKHAHGVVSCKYQVVLCFCNLQKKEVVKAEHVDVYELFRDRLEHSIW